MFDVFLDEGIKGGGERLQGVEDSKVLPLGITVVFPLGADSHSLPCCTTHTHAVDAGKIKHLIRVIKRTLQVFIQSAL
jgi:hypothetical protein